MRGQARSVLPQCTHAEPSRQRLQIFKHITISTLGFVFFFFQVILPFKKYITILFVKYTSIEMKKIHYVLKRKKEKRKGTHPKTHRKSATVEPQSQVWSVSKDHTRPVTCEGGVQPGLSGVKLLGFPGGGIVLDRRASHLRHPPPPSHCPKSGLYSLLRPLTPRRLEEQVPSPLRGPRVNSPEGVS